MRYSINEIEINLDRGFLIIKGKTRYFELNTLRVLRYLIEHSAIVVTNEQLLDELSIDKSLDNSAAVKQALAGSLQEIEVLLGTGVINIVPNIGYQWVGEIAKCTGSNLSAPDLSTVNIVKRIVITILSSLLIVWLYKNVMLLIVPLS